MGIQSQVYFLSLAQVDMFSGQVEFQARFFTQLQGNADGEGAAPTQLTLQSHITPEEYGQFANNRETQSSTRMLASERVA